MIAYSNIMPSEATIEFDSMNALLLNYFNYRNFLHVIQGIFCTCG